MIETSRYVVDVAIVDVNCSSGDSLGFNVWVCLCDKTSPSIFHSTSTLTLSNTWDLLNCLVTSSLLFSSDHDVRSMSYDSSHHLYRIHP